MSKEHLWRVVLILACIVLVETFYIIGTRSSDKRNAHSQAHAGSSEKQTTSAKDQNRLTAGSYHFDPFMGVFPDRWDSMGAMTQAQSRMNKMFRNGIGRASRLGLLGNPAYSNSIGTDLHIDDHDREYVFELDVPDIQKDDVRIDIDQRILTVSVERQTQKEESEEGQFHRFEMSSSSFSRSVMLPQDADETRITTDVENGALKVRIAKKI